MLMKCWFYHTSMHVCICTQYLMHAMLTQNSAAMIVPEISHAQS